METATGAETRYRIDVDRTVWQQLDDAVVVLDLHSSTYFDVNPSGALIWRRLLDWAAPSQLAEELVRGFGIPPRQAREDVATFLDDLRARRLLVSDRAGA